MPHVNDLSDQALFHGDLIANRRELIRALHANGGGLTSANGRATAELFGLAGVDLGNDSRSDLMKSLEADGWILRDVRGKRTYEVVLCNDHPTVARLIDFLRAEAAQPDELEDPFDVEDAESEDAVDDEQLDPRYPSAGPSADDVAHAILRKVSQLIELDTDGLVYVTDLERVVAERDEFSSRLGVTVEENQRLRQRQRDIQDELAATKQERDQLRKDKRLLEDNLKALVRNQGGEVDYEVRRRIEAFMRQTPTTKGD